MGAAARSFLERVSPAFWLAAFALGAVKAADPRLQLAIWAVIATGAGAAGMVSGAITATASHDKALLVSALLANRKPDGADDQERPSPDLRRVV